MTPLTLAQWLLASPLPKTEARMLLQQATGLSRSQLITHDHNPLTTATLITLNALAKRRLQGEPMAYILGEREFYGRTFSVSPAVLIPRPETEHLVEAVLTRLPQGGKVWDVGTGSGVIAITVALERPDAQIRASDISTDALAIAEHNARRLNAQVEFTHGSWFAVDRPSETQSYDIVVSNPPYIETQDTHLSQGDLRFEPQIALTDFSDGLSCIRTLAADTPYYLKPGGWLLLEHGYNQGYATRKILQTAGFQAVTTLVDLAGLDRMTLGQKTISAKA